MLSIQINKMAMLLSEFDFFANLQGRFSRFANLVLYTNELGHMTNMAARPIYGKNFKKSSAEPID